MFEEAKRLVRKNDGTPVVALGEHVSYAMRGANGCYDIQTLVPRDIWRTSHVLIEKGPGKVTIHNTMYTFSFLRTGTGFACLCKGESYELDSESGLIMEETVRQYTRIREWLKNRRG